MTMCSLQSIPDFGPMKHGALSFVMSRSFDDEDLGKTILEIEVRGKCGVGYCKSMPGAVRPFERLRSRLRTARIYGVNTPTKTSVTSAVLSEQWRMPEPTDLIFPSGSASFSKLSSTNRIFASTAKADPVQPTVCGIRTSACA
jgi:hypothetical protein